MILAFLLDIVDRVIQYASYRTVYFRGVNINLTYN